MLTMIRYDVRKYSSPFYFGVGEEGEGGTGLIGKFSN